MQLKWGIVGTGRICQDFCLALLTCDRHEHVIVAVSSRDKVQADNFVKEFGLGNEVRTYGSQDELFQDANVDIAYIGTIEQVHRNLCIKALVNNKHVLCEKPLAMNVDETQQIVNTARKTQKFMMEAMWSRFFPIYDYLRDAVKQIGRVNFKIQYNVEYNLACSRLLLSNVHFAQLVFSLEVHGVLSWVLDVILYKQL